MHKNTYKRVSNDETQNKITIAYTPEEGSQTLHYYINILKSIDEETLPDWIQEFRDIALMMNWSDKTGLAILKAAINPKLWSIIRNKQSINTALDTIMDYIFLESKRFIFNKELNSIRQNNYTFIEKYSEAIESSLYKWGIATKANKNEIDKRYEDIFMSGLSFESLMEMEKLGLTKADEIKKKVKKFKKFYCNFLARKK